MSRFPIQIIVFDELELIIFVSQGLTLSTASLVSILSSWLYLIGLIKSLSKFLQSHSFVPARFAH